VPKCQGGSASFAVGFLKDGNDVPIPVSLGMSKRKIRDQKQIVEAGTGFALI
jgi:hypothetical protein